MSTLTTIYSKKETVGRTHIGIYTVLKKSFPPREIHRPRNTSSISASSKFPARKILYFKTAKHSQTRNFSAKQVIIATARLTPAVAI